VSLAFLSSGPEAISRSPMEHEALAAGARLERRDGWNVAVAFDGSGREQKICRDAVGFADRSALGKIEVQASAVELAALVAATARGAPAGRGERLELGRAVRAEGAWWCPYTPERALVLCEPAATAALRERLDEAAGAVRGLAGVVDVTAAHGALTIAGPLARELFARFTAIDLRPHVTPVHGFRPGSLARVPGAILREAEERYLMLFGAALGRYVWTVVSDAAQRLGGAPVGVDALASIEEEAVSHA
jgi:heterotetrameric sarcosine oxidase gamma subunit